MRKFLRGLGFPLNKAREPGGFLYSTIFTYSAFTPKKKCYITFCAFSISNEQNTLRPIPLFFCNFNHVFSVSIARFKSYQDFIARFKFTIACYNFENNETDMNRTLFQNIMIIYLSNLFYILPTYTPWICFQGV